MSDPSDDTVLLRNSERVLSLAVRLAGAGLLFTLIASWRFYVPGFRIFGLAPLFPALAHLPDWVGYGIYALCLMALLVLLARPTARLPAAMVLACSCFWVVQDATRIQPYNYMYCYTIFTALACGRKKAVGLDALRLMICGVYFWAGFHKLNAGFYLSVFPWFISPIHTFSTTNSTVLDQLFLAPLLLTPFFEALIGVLLLFPKWRRVATGMAFIMLIVVLICLGPLGHNYGMVVWPWNIYLFLMEYFLFNTPVPVFGLKSALGAHKNAASLLSIILFWAAPVLAMYTPWYSLIGFKLYSANILTGKIQFPAHEQFTHTPPHIKELVENQRLSITQWTERELQNVLYPTPYIFQMGARGLCPYLDAPQDAQLIISAPPPFYSVQRTETVMPLCNEVIP